MSGGSWGPSASPGGHADTVGPERDLERMLSLHQATLDATQDGILVVDLDGNVASCNERFQQIWGLPDELLATGDDSLLLDHVVDQLEDPEGFMEGVQALYDDPEATSQDEIVFLDGRVVHRSSRPQRLGDEIIGRVWSFRDVTDEVRARRELERSNEELQQFAYAVSHDLQEPLRMVKGYVGLLARRYEDELDEDARTFTAYATEGVDRMQALIRSLLAYSRVETQAQPAERVDLSEVIGEVKQDLEVAIEETDAVVTSGPLPEVRAEPVQIKQVLQNLVANAIRFRSPDKPPRIHVDAERLPGAWRVAVEDNGIGIEEKHQERIFEIFQQLSPRREQQGTGVGLAIVKRIVERHGGEIEVDSEPGEGSVFAFTLPDEPANG